MKPLVVNTKVGRDGILHLDLPVGIDAADEEVQVTVERMERQTQMTTDEWRTWVASMAGAWEGEFERPPQGDYEEREPLT